MPKKDMKKILYSILFSIACFFCFILPAGAAGSTVTLPVTVLVDRDTANDFISYLGKQGYGFGTQPSSMEAWAAKLVVDARDLPAEAGTTENNRAYSTAGSMQGAMEDMLNSTRKGVLTLEVPEEDDGSTTTGRKGRYGNAACVWYKGHPFWAVEVYISNGGAGMAQGKETKTVNIEVDPSLIKFHITGWKLGSGVASTQVVSGMSAVPEINIPNFAPGKVDGVEYTCPPEILSYTANTPDLFTVTPDGVVTALKPGLASLTVALKEDPLVKQTLTFQIGGDGSSSTAGGDSSSPTTGGDNAPSTIVPEGQGQVPAASTGELTAAPEGQGKAPAVSTGKASKKLPKANITSLKRAGSRKAKLKWKKCSKISGYQIQYSTSKKLKNNVKVKTVGKKATSATLSGLKKNKTYYVRIRTYKTSNGSKAYGKWSKVRTVKIKK